MKKKILIITGGTGGHVIPAENFANYLTNNNILCSIIVDKRGKKYLNSFKGETNIIYPSSINGGFISKFISIFKLILSFISSIYIILKINPNKIVSFGSYASFPPLLVCLILKMFTYREIYIHEQNTIIGRTNKIFLIFAKKIFLNFDIKYKMKKFYLNKTFVVGSPNNNINFLDKKTRNVNKNFTVFIYGGSQGSEYLIEFIIDLIEQIKENEIMNYKFIIQCPKRLEISLKEKLTLFNCKYEINEYFKNINNILSQSSLVISRAGAGTINDLIQYKLPSILIPLPNSKDNHQYENALILKKINTSLVLDQRKHEVNVAKNYIYELYKSTKKIDNIKENFNYFTKINSNDLMLKLINNDQKN